MSVFDGFIDFLGYFAIVCLFFGVVLVAIQGSIEKSLKKQDVGASKITENQIQSELREFLDLHANGLTDDTKQEMIDDYLKHRKEAENE